MKLKMYYTVYFDSLFFRQRQARHTSTHNRKEFIDQRGNSINVIALWEC